VSVAYPVSRSGSWPVTREVEQVRRHSETGGNIGLLAGPDSAVVIVDPDNLEPWAELVAQLGDPGRPSVRTGSGKLHYHFSWEPDLPPKLRAPSGEIIGELQRGPNQQAALPPSIHPETGQPYRWLVDPSTEPLRALPDGWRAYLKRTHHRVVPLRPIRGAVNVSAWHGVALETLHGKQRASGAVKFACPQCQVEGHDRASDNAVVFPNGKWGCAWAAGTALGRRHWEAIGMALGAFGRSR
jgi:hypothetical protein